MTNEDWTCHMSHVAGINHITIAIMTFVHVAGKA